MAVRKNTVNNNDLISVLKDVTLFNGLTADQITESLECSGAELFAYEKGEKIFSEGDVPQKLPVIIDGSVMIGRDFYDGKRSVANLYLKKGDIFGYEHLFTGDGKYGLFAEAQSRSDILLIPKHFLVSACERNCGFHSLLISNMLLIMAEKSLNLNARVEIMSCSTLRQKIAKLMLYVTGENGEDSLSMNRQEMAEFLNVARPSLSRELMSMQREGLLEVSGRSIRVKNPKALEDILR